MIKLLKRIWFLILLIYCINLPANDKNINFKHLSLKDGLSHSSIYYIFQDRKGYLWFGTEYGLNRYDGYDFKKFLHDPEKNDSISSNRIRTICEDSSGNLWINTLNGGLNKFNYKTEEFTKFKSFAKSQKNHNVFHSIIIDKSGVLWIGTESGIIKFNPVSEKHHEYKLNLQIANRIKKDIITTLYIDRSDNLWVGTRYGGLYQINIRDGSFKVYKNNPDDLKSLGDNNVNCIFEDHLGIIWVGTKYGGLNRFSSNTQDFKVYKNIPGDSGSISSNNIKTVFETKAGVLWIGTGANGLNKFLSKSERFQLYEHDHNNSRSLSHNSILSIFEDRSGVLWVGTYAGGLNKLDIGSRRFKVLKNEPGNSNSLSNSTVFSVYEDSEGIIWIGTIAGLNKYDRAKNVFKVFSNDPKNPRSISDNVIRAIYEDNDGVMWIGTDNGLNKFDKIKDFYLYKNESAKKYNISSSGHIIRSIIGGGDDQLWIGTQAGLCLFNKINKKYIFYRSQKEIPGSLSDNTVRVLLNDKSGYIWAGTDAGLNKFDPKTKKFVIYKNNPDDSSSISNNSIYSIWEDKKGLLWIGTKKGLNVFDKKSGHFNNYTKKDGLENNVIYGVLEDNKGDLWLSTDMGLSRATKNKSDGSGQTISNLKLNFRNYNIYDGVQGHEFNAGASYKDLKGLLYFGGMNGLNIIDRSKIKKDNSYIPPVVLTELRLFSNIQLKSSINFTNKIVLPYNKNYISVKFAALDFTDSEKNEYAYLMEGLTKKWIDLGTKRELGFYLAPGNYLLKIKGSNSDHVWNEEGVSLKVVISPPPWNTWWAYTLFLLIASGFIVMLLKYQRNKIKIKEKELILEKQFSNQLEQRVKERTSEVVKQKSEIQFQAEQLSITNKELEKLSMVAKETDNAVMILDVDGTIEWVNEGFTHMNGYTLEQLIKERGNNLIEASAFTEIEQLLKKCIKEKKTISYEALNKTMLGKNIWAQTTLTPILGNDGNVEKIIAIDSDISRIKYSEEVAEEARKVAENANQSKSEFLARMSHEIRTPMNGVIGFTDIILDTNLSDEQVEFARTIKRSGEALLTILNDILDFSKIEAEELTFENIDFDPEVTIFDVCDLMFLRIGSKNIEILCRIGDDVPAYISGDVGRFRQVIMNLMGNAVKFTEKGEIELSLEVEKELENKIKLHVMIRDTGIGIPQDKIKTIFEPFHQADGSTARKYGGTGLGLAICKQLAGLMEGDVWVESQEEEGSVFHFTCLVKRSEKITEERKKFESLEGKRVLIVDDNINSTEILSNMLSSSKMKVKSVLKPENVIFEMKKSLTDEDIYNIVVIDIKMPGISGFELAKEIRALEQPLSDIPLLTFSSSLLARSEIYNNSGFNGFLPKPIQRKKLLKIIEQIIIIDSNEKKYKKDEIVTQYTIADQAKHSIEILLVEDNQINQKLAGFLLKQAGYKLNIVNNGREAVEVFCDNPEKYDLILMDIQMPEMDGNEATKLIRDKGFNNIPIIAMTAGAMKGDREKCIKAGMNDYISKPIKREMVFKIIQKWCLK